MHQTVQSLEFFCTQCCSERFSVDSVFMIALEFLENSHLVLSGHSPESDEIFDLVYSVQTVHYTGNYGNKSFSRYTAVLSDGLRRKF